MTTYFATAEKGLWSKPEKEQREGVTMNRILMPLV
jgi:hypothetical protein